MINKAKRQIRSDERNRGQGGKPAAYRYMCLFISALVILSSASVVLAQEGVIGEILIKGNRNITDKQILGRVRSREGVVFEESTADKDVERIAELPGVESSYYNKREVEGKIQLAFVVVEKNLIRSIDFVGNKRNKDSRLSKELGFKRGNYLDPIQAEEGRGAIVAYYHKKGYAFAGVNLDTEQLSKGDVVYKIQEGARVKIASVKFEGNKAIKSKTLKKAVKTKEKKWFFLRKYYQESTLTGDEARLQKIYQRKGFLNTDIEVRRGFSEDKSKIYITFEINEGKVYVVNEVSLSGNQHFDKERLEDEINLKKGQVYSSLKADSDAKRILSLYHRNGFVNATVGSERIFISEREVTAHFIITEGERFKIGQVNITGNEETQDKVIRRVLNEYEFKPGQWYNADIARGNGNGELEKRIQRSTMMESATITPRGETSGLRDAQVSVVEGRTGMVMLGAGVASDSGVIGQLSIEQRNFDISDKPESFYEFITGKAFKGAGQTLRINLQPGTRVSQYSISFTEPYLQDKPIQLDVIGSSWSRYRESFDEKRTKGYVGFEKRYKNDWRGSIGIRAENVKVESIDNDAPQEIRDVEGDNNLFGIKIGLSRRLTDDIYNPAKGYSFNVGYEQVGGEGSFGILSGVYRRYTTLYKDLLERKTVLSTKFLAATTVGDAPPFEKFYAGGSGTYGVRGFDYRGISTRDVSVNSAGVPLDNDKDEPIGSDWIFLANGEVTVPLVSDNFSALFFLDSAAIDTGGYRASVGTGIQILIPQWFGPVPMRFELATPLRKDDADETRVFSFSVGRLF